MSNDPSPLKYMGTQSHETMAMEAALARRAARSTEQAADIVADRTAIGGAAPWAIDKAKDKLRSAAGYIGKRVATTLETRMRQDPTRAILIAVGTGAVLMGLVAMMARSGARTATRNLQR